MSTKWTMITGASEGLGVEFARLAAAEGRDLILVARQVQKLERLADELRARHNVAIEVLPTDLSDPKAVEALWRRAEMRRHIDVLVNNAGLGYNGPFTGSEFNREMSSIMVNVTGLTILMKRAVAHMTRQGGGHILNVGSTAGFMPGPNMAVYHATKAYVLSLTEAVAEELRDSPVTVTVLCPGATATNFIKDAQMEDIALLKALPVASAKRVAKAGWTAMKKGKRIRVTGLLNKFFAVSPRFAPRALTTRITALFMK
ncbi:MAG: SDR family oxidoreductase [Albidovulum sp.]|uniref:SDR family NAD(P)-dependent oxidoreductase n=1 Tax=Albidovulum sp. TaxID=1872424 RepID=UPI003C8498F2